MTKNTAPEPNHSVVARPNPGVEPDDDASTTSSLAAPGERLVIARRFGTATDEILELVRSALELAASEAEAGASLAELEAAVGGRVVAIAQHALAFVFASACRAAMQRDIQERALTRDDFRLRTDDAGYVSMHTTFGPITFPIFAYRDLSTPAASVTRTPARTLFPYHRSCRSSPLCLQWEARLGLQHPFRKAEEMLHFFTRGASTVEDTTIARHMLALSRMVEPEWLYRAPDDIRKTLRDKATRDKVSGCPLIYVSSDAHALRRYVGDTWALQWKMVNGIRVWCEDAETGQIIHLGGEFTWGDCHQVAERIRALRDTGILPNDESSWQAVDAQTVFVSDGSAWLLDHLVPLLVAPVVILDPYHLIDWFAEFTSLAFGAGSKRSLALHAELRRILFNKQPKRASKAPGPRRGHKKNRRRRNTHAYDRRWAHRGRPRTVSSEFTTEALFHVLAGITVTEPAHQEALDALADRVANNTFRIDYAVHLARGLQIGSGAMESLHRIGSQQRLKLPGARWLEDSSQAILQFRMLELSGRWDEFWSRRELPVHIGAAFVAQRPTPPTDHQASEAA